MMSGMVREEGPGKIKPVVVAGGEKVVTVVPGGEHPLTDHFLQENDLASAVARIYLDIKS